MRKIIAGTVLAALALTGCGGSEPSREDRERILVEVINEEIPETMTVPDDEVVELAESICDGLDSGESIYDIGFTGVEAGFTPYQAGFIIGASIDALCPEHREKVDNL